MTPPRRSVAVISRFRFKRPHEGVVKLYDIKPLFEKIPAFNYLKEHPEEFACVSVDVGGYGIIWGDE
ncbi:MAG: DUF2442 domain-containing protein, partial [Oscillospiraceae bacterium]|nr:DUF2442 domain-containing protein [Oscillospiraceae bacterium]